MKILILNTHDLAGGAARAAHRLHCALRSQGVASTMRVQFKSNDDPTIIGPQRPASKALALARSMLDSLPTRLYRKKEHAAFSPAWWPNRRLLRDIAQMDPDIVHLHWIAGGFLRIEDLSAIRRPVVWTLHDMWPFTGGCHYDDGCGKYRRACGRCPVLSSERGRDLSSWTFQRKCAAFSKWPRLTVVAPSQWLADSAAASPLLRDRRVVRVPNPIDTQRYHRVDGPGARRLWNLPLDKRLILFGAPKATHDPRKGWQDLQECLDRLRIEDAEFVLFGAGPPAHPPRLRISAHYVGRLNDDVSMVTLFSACDVTVVPSRQENLSNVVMESLSCGTPVVAYRIGGNGDLVRHRQNGYLSEPFDADDLARGIEWVLEDRYRWRELSRNSRQKAEVDFDNRPVAGQYADVYRSVLAKAAGA